MFRLHLLCGIVSLLAALPCVCAGADQENGPQPDTPRETSSNADQDEQFRRQVVGTWEDDYQGKRTMTLEEDGTGTMVVELRGIKARLFASRLRFDMKWSVKDGRLHKQTIGGEPAVKVQMILKTMGDRVDEPILELTGDRLVLQDRDGKTKYDWRRAELDAE